MKAAIVLLLITFYSLCGAQSTRYVRAEAAGDGTGSSWENASGDLQAMINASASGDQIFVEVGTYKPNRRADDVNTIIEGDRNNAFVLKAGVSVYGGFDPGHSITDLSHHRKLPGAGADNGSILSGDLGTADDYSDNAYHVMIATEGGTLDGFTIRYGNANNDLNITVNGQTISHDRGGGIQILGPAAYVANCWLQGNRAIRGGGVYTNTIPIFENCIFSGNYVTTLSGNGGHGGGLYVENSGGLNGAYLVNCTFSGNKANNGAGGAIYNASSTSKITLYNAIIYGNSATNGLNGIRNQGTISAFYSLINDQSELNNITNHISGNPLFQDQISTENAPFITGDYGIQSGSPAINAGVSGLNISVVDIAGNPRIQFGTPDLGALESENGVKAGSIVYVKETGTGNGSSWANATNDLQVAIHASTGQVWVAGGTYKPNRKANATGTITPNNRDNAFVLKNDIKIYGGFAGTETSLTQRDLSLTENKSTLSGDFNGNDGVSGSGGSLSFSGNGENAYHVVIAPGIGSGTVLDGFTITGGNANGSGTNNVNGQPIFKESGGGLYNMNNIGDESSGPQIINCIFTQNRCSSEGGGLYSSYSGNNIFNLVNCVFFRNAAISSGAGWGGAIANRSASKIKMINCTIWGNRAEVSGGAIYNALVGSITLQNSIVYGNNSSIGGNGDSTRKNSLVQGYNSTSNGNIPGSTNPQFVNASGGDFRLKMSSPAINAGNNNDVPSGVTKDIAGNDRIQDCNVVDMGAYENTITAPDVDDQTFCAGNTIADLEPGGVNFKWYAAAIGGTPLSEDTELVWETSYYVSQTINDCESPRAEVNVTYSVEAPTSPSPQNFSFSGITVSGLEATGENLQWYSTATGGEVLDPSEIVMTGTYYVSQTIDGCESGRTAVTVTVAHTARYIKPVASGSGDGSNWNNASDDLQAMINASVSDNVIFVAGGTYKPNRPANNLSTIDDGNRDNAFVLKDGVKIYGNFAGTETSLEQRDLSSADNKSTLSGDFNGNDVVSGSGGTLSISGNSENTYHVVIAAGSGTGIVLDGFTITGGYANSYLDEITVNGQQIDRGLGGGLNNTGNSAITIANCIFTGNHAAHGGGVYSEYLQSGGGNDLTYINTVFSKNRGNNYGGGVLNDNYSRVSRFFNCTFWGNRANTSGGGIHSDRGSVILRNSIIYGNNSGVGLISGSITQQYSLVQGEESTSNGNIPGSTNPQFVNASGGDFRLKMSSPAINAGNSEDVPSGVTKDIAGNPRIQDCNVVDMGAYENTITAPDADDQTFCAGETVADLVAEGENLQWYDTAESGTLLAIDTALVTESYYVSQTINDCESPRTEVVVTVYSIPSSPTADAQTFCIGTVADLTATGENLQWYDAAEGGTPLALETELVSGTYYVSQTINDCESPRTEVAVTVHGIPSSPTADVQTFCSGTVADLTATGENLQWYDVAEGGTPLALETELVSGTYYVSQTINDCESPRTVVAVSVIYGTEMPTAPSPQNFSGVTTVAALTATGDNLQWYETATGGIPLAPDVIITTGTYYVSQTIDGCKSPRAEVVVLVSYLVRYVKQNASGNGDGANWDNASDDLQAMINTSVSGDMIFVAEGTYKPIRPANNLNTIDYGNRDNAFVLKNEVKIYGGFTGTEISLAQRNLGAGHTTILSGDFNGNDVVSGSGGSLGISGNGENAHRVVISMGNGSSETVLDGFTIQGGNAVGSSNITVNGTIINNDYGGGMYYYNSKTTVANCIFTQNRAERGGGLYTGGNSVDFTIVNCIFSKNRATDGGGALYNVRRPYIINSTFWGNRSTGSNTSAIFSGTGTFYFQNSIVYGNNGGFSSGTSSLNISYSLIQGESSTSNGNINGDTDPLFVDAPGGDFSLQETSPVINEGNNSYIPSDITKDIAGNIRIQMGTVDIGAYEWNRKDVIWTTSNNWLNDVEPDEEKDVFIEGDLNVGTDYGDFSAQTLTVEEGGSITIHSGNSVTVNGKITNNAGEENFIVENDGNLIQVNDVENEGAITVRRNSTPMMRLDYALWSSPVDGQGIHAFSPETVASRIYTYEGEDSYQLVPDLESDFIAGKGYMFRAPNNWNLTTDANGGNPVAYPGEFKGVPFNGDININVYSESYTSVGNPYPSNLNLGSIGDSDTNTFLGANQEVGTIYFWTNTNPADGAGGYTGNNWATYTLMGGTSASGGSAIPQEVIAPGQGFIISSTESGTSVSFNNTMRTSEDTIFFKDDEEEPSRFWLNLQRDNSESYNQILVGYLDGATYGIDHQIDGIMFGYEGSAIYNLIDQGKFTIQGRSLPFEAADVVPIGFRAIEDGKYRITLSDYQGLFAEGQITIYLKDKALHIIHNLMESDYDFESIQGEFNERFEIIYQEEGTMGTDEQNANEIRIYKDKDYIVVDSKTEKILSVELYDLSGRNLYREENINANHYRVKSPSKGIIVVKARSETGEIVTKKVINN